MSCAGRPYYRRRPLRRIPGRGMPGGPRKGGRQKSLAPASGNAFPSSSTGHRCYQLCTPPKLSLAEGGGQKEHQFVRPTPAGSKPTGTILAIAGVVAGGDFKLALSATYVTRPLVAGVHVRGAGV